MATKPKAKRTAKVGGKYAPNAKQTSRFWLMYPPKLIQRPVVWELSQKFKLITNVRQASVTDEIGIVCLELGGARDEIKAGIKWLEACGVRVEPVEINVLES